MKKLILFAISIVFSINMFAQTDKTTAASVGVMMGGGSLIGVDVEYVIPKSSLGLQVGAGIFSVGAAINYHLKPDIRSSMISLQYYRQGFGDNYYASWLGPMFIFRAKKIFQAGLGIGALIDKGDKWYTLTEAYQNSSGSLLFQLGVYF